ncbi:hypothetical protein DFH05DRAFT_1503970 [Lentinula detonsa]|uniref:Uncharacterized protein n=1 Tax=Lentinula detonsa TaxID=2804962 RepID=A0A9W8NWG4_9AGAR|nr:hypothetical protein DFH05DRAFT_1503970 [Lentinula detonsa]
MVNLFTRAYNVGPKLFKNHDPVDTKAELSSKAPCSTISVAQLQSTQRSSLRPTQGALFQYEPRKGLNRCVSDFASSLSSGSPSHSSHAQGPKQNRLSIWLKRSITSVDRTPRDYALDDDQHHSTPHGLESSQECLKFPVYHVQAWKPMPTYCNGTTLAVSASEGEIVDPFRKGSPPPVTVPHRAKLTTRSLPGSWSGEIV